MCSPFQALKDYYCIMYHSKLLVIIDFSFDMSLLQRKLIQRGLFTLLSLACVIEVFTHDLYFNHYSDCIKLLLGNLKLKGIVCFRLDDGGLQVYHLARCITSSPPFIKSLDIPPRSYGYSTIPFFGVSLRTFWPLYQHQASPSI